VTRQTRGTLTSINSDSMYTSIMPMALCWLCTMAILYPGEPLNYKITFASSPLCLLLSRASFHSVTRLHHQSTTIGVIPLSKLTDGLHPTSTLSYQSWKASTALWLPWAADSCKVATRIGTSNQANNDPGQDERTTHAPHNNYSVIYITPSLWVSFL
jgi:hypothetical protein